jgi:hypothetical protein
MQAISTKLQIQVREKKTQINLFFANFKKIRHKRRYNVNKVQDNC